jgi:hypothetical protein
MSYSSALATRFGISGMPCQIRMLADKSLSRQVTEWHLYAMPASKFSPVKG